MEADSVEAQEKYRRGLSGRVECPRSPCVVREPFSLGWHRRDLPERCGVQGRSGRFSAVPGNIGMLLFAEIGP
jgi:hypothetical protein